MIFKYFNPFQLCMLLTGCATVIHGTTEKIPISTNPPDAIVTNGEDSIQTPAIFELKRNKEYLLTISKPGYEPQNIKISEVVSGAVAGNLILGGILGVALDTIDGAMWRLEPESITVTLCPLPEGEENFDTSTTAAAEANMLQELSALKKQDILTEDEFQAMRKVTLQLFKPTS